MKAFMDKDFLLRSDTAKVLYHEAAAGMPIYDYHNHLPPREIFENQPYRSITEVWLAHDHYKWRAMRAAGVPEHLITGPGDDQEKFRAWAGVIARLPMCPLYHWTHLELQRYFGIYEPLSARSADEIYAQANAMLSGEEFRPRQLLARMNVRMLGTTDNPWDRLEWHEKLSHEDIPYTVRPTFRPDKLLLADADGWKDCVALLSQSEGMAIDSYDAFLAALEHSLDRFAAAGCKAVDHGFSTFEYLPGADGSAAFAKAIAGQALSHGEALALRSDLLRRLAASYARRGLVMQLHTGVVRNPNAKQFARLGPDSGYDCVGPVQDPYPYHALFSELEAADALPKVILYGIHPADTQMFATMAVSYCRDQPGRMQLGSAWWFNDSIAGMRQQLTAAAEAGLLSGFVGMLTDSRSMTSFTRHEYFRRILCDLLGEAVEDGQFPASELDTLKALVRDVCFDNAKIFFEEDF